MNKAEILIIDDEPQIRRLLDITLQSNQYLVKEAMNAREGLTILSGRNTVTVLAHLVVVFVTNVVYSALARSAIAFGVTAFVISTAGAMVPMPRNHWKLYPTTLPATVAVSCPFGFNGSQEV